MRHIHKNVKTTGLTRSSRNFTPCGESAGSQHAVLCPDIYVMFDWSGILDSGL